MAVYEKLLKVQKELKAPKDIYNDYGKYNYRSCESILEGVKPLLDKNKATIILCDELVASGDSVYIKATAKFVDIETGEEVLSAAFARQELVKKGMDAAQITGSTSSYARKYALCGLLLIDDNKDIDSMHTEEPKETPKAPVKPIEKPVRKKTRTQLIAELEGLGVPLDAVVKWAEVASADELSDEKIQEAITGKIAKENRLKKVGGSAALDSLNLKKG